MSGLATHFGADLPRDLVSVLAVKHPSLEATPHLIQFTLFVSQRQGLDVSGDGCYDWRLLKVDGSEKVAMFAIRRDTRVF